MKHGISRLAIAGAALSLVLTGCASGSVSGGDDAPGADEGTAGAELQTVTLGIFPSGTFGPLYLAIENGLFEEHGIKLELDTGQGGAALLPAVTTGSLDFAIGSPISPLTASAQGLDVRIASGYSIDDVDALDDTAVVVAGAGSGIKSSKDLAGKTVAVNALKAAGEIGIREAVKADGGDPTTINFIELSFPDVAAQIESGGVDAAMIVPPFTQGVLASGGAVVSDFTREAGIGPMSLVAFTSGKLADDNPELVEAFTAALAEALDYAQNNLDEMRAVLPDAMGMDPELAKTLPFETFTADIDMEALETYVRLMAEYGVVDSAPDLDAIVIK
jgi:NitT/TauT family transport system substrate-binding protein